MITLLDIMERFGPQGLVLAVVVLIGRLASKRFDLIDAQLGEVCKRLGIVEKTQAVHEDRWERSDPTPVEVPIPCGSTDGGKKE